MVRRYCDAHFISTELSVSVRKYVEWMQSLEAKQQHNDHEEELMQLLPIDLRRSLLTETRSPLLSKHTVFFACRESNWRFFQRLCCDTMSPVATMPDVNVFSYGMRCTRMYFIVAGELAYLKYGAVQRLLMQNGSLFKAWRQADDHRYREAISDQASRLDEGTVLCEPVLWTRWVHLGDLSSITHASFLVIELVDFENLVWSYPAVQMSLVKHAQRFVAGLNAFAAGDLCDLFDTEKTFRHQGLA